MGNKQPSPLPAEIAAARKAAGLSRAQAAALVLVGVRAYQQWEAGERQMSAAHWYLFRLRLAGHHLPGPESQVSNSETGISGAGPSILPART
jgi:transcriptional regulator with XRE-family HTH domain